MKVYAYNNGHIIKKKSLLESLGIDIDKDKVITLVGAGGKTSTIFRLGKDISNLNKKAIITTTTHMGMSKDMILVECNSDLKKVKYILNKDNLIKVGQKESDHKIKSLDYDLLKKVISMSDVTLIEGDGSRNLPLKVPREYEPVIIEETNLVIGLIGIDCLDKKIKDACHKPELVSIFLGKNVDQIVEIEDLVKIATSENGLKKCVNCRYKVIVNKVDDEKYLDKCKKIAELLQKSGVDVVFTSYIDD